MSETITARSWLLTEGNQYVAIGEFALNENDKLVFVDEDRKSIPVPVWAIEKMLDAYRSGKLITGLLRPDVVIHAKWIDDANGKAWCVDIDGDLRNSAFITGDTLEEAIQKAIPSLLENRQWRKNRCGEKLDLSHEVGDSGDLHGSVQKS